jgi:hypothetical protein
MTSELPHSPIKVEEQLKNYLSQNGLKVAWLARRIGLSVQRMSSLLAGQAPIPLKHWTRILEVLPGCVSLADIFKSKLHDIPELEISNLKDGEACFISLRKINK